MNPQRPPGRKWDWRLLFGMSLTAVWLWGGAYYISNTIGWSQFLSQPLESLGSFLEGAFAPLAFLWLVIGYFLQQKELSRNTDAIQQQYIEMQRSSDQAELQAKSIQANSDHNRRLTFMRLHDMVRESLGSITGLLYISSQGVTGDDYVDRTVLDSMWSEMKRGDHELFGRQFMIINFRGEQDMYELFYGTEIRRKHTEAFISQFERLLANACECDPDQLIPDAVKSNVNGRMYKLIIQHTKDKALPEEW